MRRMLNQVRSNERSQRGFTLIEFLLVIVVVAALAFVVVISINSSQDKSSDTSAKATVNHIRAAAVLVYDESGDTYIHVCDDGDTKASGAPTNDSSTNIVMILLNSAVAETGGTSDCNDTDEDYAAAVQLRANNAQYFCVDADGHADVYTGVIGGTGSNDFRPDDVTCE